MATRTQQLRTLRQCLIQKDAEIEATEKRLDKIKSTAAFGKFTKLSLKVIALKKEAENLQSRIVKRETTRRKKEREAASE